MAEFVIVTDEQLARAREDVDFRHQLLTDHLNWLISEINRLRDQVPAHPRTAERIREGTQVTVRLAAMLRATEAARIRKPRAA